MARKISKKEKEMVIVGPAASDADDEDEDLDTEEESEDDDKDEDDEEGEDEAGAKGKSKDEEEDGDSDEDDERVGHGEDDEEDDEDGKGKKRERESRKARRERQRKAKERNQVELNFLRQQNEALERKVQKIEQSTKKNEITSVDQRITSVQSQLRVADQVLAKAHEEGTGEDVVEATNIRDKLKETLGQLHNYKQTVSRQAEEEPEVDSRLVYNAQRWMSQNDWYDPKGTDKDSRAVAAIDNRLVEEGYDPRTSEYWDELTSRVKRRLPHKFEDRRRADEADDEDDDGESRRSRKRSGGPRFSSGGRERPLKKNEVYISPERKQAMVQAGVWDDPVLRNKYLKRYAQYDRDNRGQRSGR